MTFGSYTESLPKDFDIIIAKSKRVERCRYFGVTFDAFMRWDKHI